MLEIVKLCYYGASVIYFKHFCRWMCHLLSIQTLNLRETERVTRNTTAMSLVTHILCQKLRLSSRTKFIHKFSNVYDCADRARGGSRLNVRHKEVTASIIAHISSFKCRESHYGRGKSVRGYLLPTLSMKRMWTRKPCYRKDDRAMRPMYTYKLFTLILFTLTVTILCADVDSERI